jgi:L-2-hydroxyglutarate oxidase LhgO
MDSSAAPRLHERGPSLMDAVVIGAGVIGLAVARALAADGHEVVLLERHAHPGMETSSRNSEVIHAGMYYPPGSLKARLCVAANPGLYRWCESHRVPHRRIGKFIVATTSAEEPELARLLERAAANGVPGLRAASAGELAREEPDVRAVAALWSPDTGIVDSHALMQSLEQDAREQGCSVAYGHAFRSAEFAGAGYTVRCTGPDGGDVTIKAATVINSAGLEADTIAAGMGIDLDAAGYRQVYVKGCYFRLAEGAPVKPRHLVYPVPNPALTGLGVHVTLDLAGGIRLGPDVEFLADRIADYRVPPERAVLFAERAGRYLPGLRTEDLRPDQSGIRPRRMLPGGVVPDFVIAEESARGFPGWVNLIGMESPGLTCCLEIGRAVAALLP